MPTLACPCPNSVHRTTDVMPSSTGSPTLVTLAPWLGCVLMLALGSCNSAPPVPSPGQAASCDLDRNVQTLTPGQLVNAFAARAGAGDFATSGSWLRGVEDCPDREPAQESFHVVRQYSVMLLDSEAAVVRYLLILDEVGTQAVHFRRAPRIHSDTLTVHRTTYGWRLFPPSPSVLRLLLSVQPESPHRLTCSLIRRSYLGFREYLYRGMRDSPGIGGSCSRAQLSLATWPLGG